METSYGITVPNTKKQELDKIQNEAARIATGTTKLVTLYSLYNEICWESLECRRNNHKLTLFYKMVHNSIPLYLTSLKPQSVSSISRYNLRNSKDLQTIDARTNQFYMSFLPSSVRPWNNLSVDVQQCDSAASFKRFLQKDNPKVPPTLLFRLRTNCSSLNFDLFVKNIVDSPLCLCGSIENAQHFFFYCTFYQARRNELINAVTPYQFSSHNLFLYGDLTLSQEINRTIFYHVDKFITDSKRFGA